MKTINDEDYLFHSPAISIEPIDVSAVKKEEEETMLIAQEAQNLTIKNPRDYENAGVLRMKIKGKLKEIEEKRKSITIHLDTAKKNIFALFSPLTERLTNAVTIIDKHTIAYNEEQEYKAKVAQAKADEEARKAREKTEAKAKELAAQGREEKAQVMQEKADNISAPVYFPFVPKVAGQSIQDRWYAEVVDFKTLPDEYKLPDISKLDRVAQACKGRLEIPGVAFKVKKIVSGRSY